MPSPLKEIQVLLPVWGARYVEQCLDFCLPSLLAAGNLPALREMAPTVLVLMVSREDVPKLDRHPVISEARHHCEVRFLEIDDLISASSSTVLTLAYAQALRSAGAAALDTAFVFLVSDYVLASGSLRFSVRRLAEGASGVLAGNFQVEAEGAGALLRERRAGAAAGNALDLSPRDLVRVSLAHLHASTIACMAENRVAHAPEANRFFWRAGDDALVGRFYLMHMVAIRPERLHFVVNGPSDFVLIPELCPSGKLFTVSDSDDYCVVELQGAGDRKPRWVFEPLTPRHAAHAIESWATTQHRGNAATAVTFHAGTIGPAVIAARKRSADFVSSVAKRFTRPAADHADHRFWVGALHHHDATSLDVPDAHELSRLTGTRPMEGGVPASPMQRARRLLFGRGGAFRPWHPRYPDAQLVLRTVREIAGGNDLFIVSSAPASVRARLTAVASRAGAQKINHQNQADLQQGTAAPGPNDVVLLLARNEGEVAAALEALFARNGDLGRLVLMLGDAFSESLERVSDVASIGIDDLIVDLECDDDSVQVASLPCGPWRLGVQLSLIETLQAGVRGGGSAMARSLGVIIALATLSFLTNVHALRSGRRRGSQAISLLKVDLGSVSIRQTPASARSKSEAPVDAEHESTHQASRRSMSPARDPRSFAAGRE